MIIKKYQGNKILELFQLLIIHFGEKFGEFIFYYCDLVKLLVELCEIVGDTTGSISISIFKVY